MANPKNLLKGFHPQAPKKGMADGGSFAGLLDHAATLAPLAAPFAKAALASKLAIFAGVGAKTADKKKLGQAQDMQANGASRDEAWGKTGWDVGNPDGKPRFEIDDSKASMKTKDLTSNGRLGDVLDHPALFKAYPELADMTTSLEPRSSFGSLSNNSGGTWGRQIHAGTKQPDFQTQGDWPTSVLLHEIQHAIQVKEGFAQGGNIHSAPDMAAHTRAIKAVHGLIASDPDGVTKDAIEKARKGAFDAKDDMTPFDQYLATPGEKESRDVQGRMTLSDSERRAATPWNGAFSAKLEPSDLPPDVISPDVSRKTASFVSPENMATWRRLNNVPDSIPGGGLSEAAINRRANGGLAEYQVKSDTMMPTFPKGLLKKLHVPFDAKRPEPSDALLAAMRHPESLTMDDGTVLHRGEESPYGGGTSFLSDKGHEVKVSHNGLIPSIYVDSLKSRAERLRTGPETPADSVNVLKPFLDHYGKTGFPVKFNTGRGEFDDAYAMLRDMGVDVRSDESSRASIVPYGWNGQVHPSSSNTFAFPPGFLNDKGKAVKKADGGEIGYADGGSTADGNGGPKMDGWDDYGVTSHDALDHGWNPAKTTLTGPQPNIFNPGYAFEANWPNGSSSMLTGQQAGQGVHSMTIHDPDGPPEGNPPWLRGGAPALAGTVPFVHARDATDEYLSRMAAKLSSRLGADINAVPVNAATPLAGLFDFGDNDFAHPHNRDRAYYNDPRSSLIDEAVMRMQSALKKGKVADRKRDEYAAIGDNAKRYAGSFMHGNPYNWDPREDITIPKAHNALKELFNHVNPPGRITYESETMADTLGRRYTANSALGKFESSLRSLISDDGGRSLLKILGRPGARMDGQAGVRRPSALEAQMDRDGDYDIDRRAAIAKEGLHPLYHIAKDAILPISSRQEFNTWRAARDKKMDFSEPSGIESVIAPDGSLRPNRHGFLGAPWLGRPVVDSTPGKKDGGALGMADGGQLSLPFDEWGTPDPNYPVTAYQGGPHSVQDGYSDDYLGKGEGNASYGQGHYFAGNPAIAKQYRDNLSEGLPTHSWGGFDDLVKPYDLGGGGLLDNVKSGKMSPEEAVGFVLHRGSRNARNNSSGDEFLDNAQKRLTMARDDAVRDDGRYGWLKKNLLGRRSQVDAGDAVLKALQNMRGQGLIHSVREPGHEHKVGVKANPGDMLQWDKKMSEQPESMQGFMREAFGFRADDPGAPKAFTGKKGGDWLRGIEGGSGGLGSVFSGYPDLTSARDALRDHGVPGVRYLNGFERHKKGALDDPKSYNYVVHNPKDVDILDRKKDGGEVSQADNGSLPAVFTRKRRA